MATSKLERAQGQINQQALHEKQVEIVKNDRDKRVTEMRSEIQQLEIRVTEAERLRALYEEKYAIEVRRTKDLEQGKMHAESAFNKLQQDRDAVQARLTRTLAEALQNNLRAATVRKQFEFYRNQSEKAERRERINEAEIQ